MSAIELSREEWTLLGRAVERTVGPLPTEAVPLARLMLVRSINDTYKDKPVGDTSLMLALLVKLSSPPVTPPAGGSQ
jgi:hypothetical protein